MEKVIYEPIENETGSYVKKTDPDGTIWSVPIDPANSDYQAYLNKDEAEQSTPNLAD